MSSKPGFEVKLDQPYQQALETLTTALKTEGFGVMTTIDVRATLKEKLGEEFRPYAILGVCNPPLAHQALSHNAEVGLMLPCNVTVEAAPVSGTIIRIADPAMMLGVGEFASDPVLASVADEARTRLMRVAAALAK